MEAVMNFEYIQEFTMVAKHGNLSEAAHELYTTQSALSRHLSQLEKELGAPLFDRSTNPMVLTHIGEVFLRDCHSLVNEYVRTKDKISRLKETDFETLRITGITDPAIIGILRQVKEKLQKSAPQIVIKLVTGAYQVSFEMLRRGEADVAIEPLSELIDIHDLENTRLLNERSVVVVEKGSPIASQELFTDEDFAKARFISLRSNKEHGIRKHMQTLARRRGYVGDIPAGLMLSPLDSYRELFMEGFDGAYLMLPDSMAQELCAGSRGEYVAIPFSGSENNFDIHVFYSAKPSSKVQTFLDVLREFLALN
jgi:DNA-binding transcriptional LysR family regulator